MDYNSKTILFLSETRISSPDFKSKLFIISPNPSDLNLHINVQVC